MLYFLFYLKDQFILFNVFKYITFRSFGAGVTAFLICLFLGGKFINFLKERQFRENIRSDGPPGHMAKEGTPTMGGTFIVLAIIFSTVLWVNLSNTTIIIAMFFMISYAIIGFTDDWLKLNKGEGMRAKVKFLLQIVVGAFFIILLMIDQKSGFTMTLRLDESQLFSFSTVVFPLFKKAMINLGLLYLPFALLVVVGSSNAVNLTDGLDGAGNWLNCGCGFNLYNICIPFRKYGIFKLSPDTLHSFRRRTRSLFVRYRRCMPWFPLVQLPPRPDIYGRRRVPFTRSSNWFFSFNYKTGTASDYSRRAFSYGSPIRNSAGVFI